MEDFDTLIFPHPNALIGRECELSLICAALNASPLINQIFYLSGDGGVGKTILLQQVHNEAHHQRDTVGRQLLETGIIDLQDVRYNQALMIMRTMRNRLLHSLAGLDIGVHVSFTNFDKEVREYRVIAGIDPVSENAQRQRIEAAFLADYRQLAQHYPIVILFDTFERLDMGKAETEEFNVHASRHLDEWLIDLARKLPHTLVLIAGRKRYRQLDLLQAGYQQQLVHIEVGALQPGETEAFVRASLQHIAPDLIDDWEVFSHISGGRPIVLLIAMACALAGTLDLTGIDALAGSSSERLSNALYDLIFHEVAERRADWFYLLTRALYLRKGLSHDLLRQMALGETPPHVPQIDLDTGFSTFGALPIVKRIGDRVITLHDELYDLLFGRVEELKDSRLWYQQAIRHLEQQMQAAPARSGDDQIFQVPLRQALQVERLFYQICLDPLAGYQDYRELSFSAIRSHAHDFDALLRTEFARFFDLHTTSGAYYRDRLALGGLSWQHVRYDEAVRWVYRCNFLHIQGENRYERGLSTAAAIRRVYDTIYVGDPLSRDDLIVAELEAKLYLDEHNSDEHVLDTAYATITYGLEQLARREPLEVVPGSIQSLRQKQIKRILATAYDDWGYYVRLWYHFGRAVTYYKRALKLYSELGSESDLARSLSLNSCGYALTLQGDLERGLALVDEAQRLAENLGAEHQRAICLNTRARILLQLDQVNEALASVSEARKIFEQVVSHRNLALCAHAEGNIRRWVAYSSRHERERSQREYRRAIVCYKEAIRLLPKKGELIRQVEFLQGLGCTYRSRGFAHFQRGERVGRDMEIARSYLQQALDLCPPERHGSWPIVPALLEDIAVTYINEDRFAEAQPYLAQAQAAIPPIYRIEDSAGLNDIPETRDHKIYWLRLGQVELQYALCRFGEGEYVSACARLVRAFACILTFSPHAVQLSALRALGRRELAAIGDRTLLEQLRDDTYWSARRLNLTDTPFTEVDRLFSEVIEDMELGITGDPRRYRYRAAANPGEQPHD
ncbi:MAG: ATP-binding protein [Oscillochloris sp.]|nr:ATP-binding protein [Oscillochloris sp.]